MRAEHEETLIIPAGRRELEADLIIPADARGLVLFAHGSGAGAAERRTSQVAAALRERGLGTLMFELLAPEEEQEALRHQHPHFDLPLLTSRLGEVTDWIQGRRAVGALPLGYFATDTGTAAALISAARRPRAVRAIVSRGGRPDLARDALDRVQAATLLIVGGEEAEVLHLNEEALERIPGAKHLVVVPGSTHLTEEPGGLYEVCRLASDWFLDHLAEPARQALHP